MTKTTWHDCCVALFATPRRVSRQRCSERFLVLFFGAATARHRRGFLHASGAAARLSPVFTGLARARLNRVTRWKRGSEEHPASRIDLARGSLTCSANTSPRGGLTSAIIRVSAPHAPFRLTALARRAHRALVYPLVLRRSGAARPARPAAAPRHPGRRAFVTRRLRGSSEASSAARLTRTCGLSLYQSLRDLLTIQAGHHAVEQTLTNTDEGVALANPHVGSITLADPGRAECLV